MPGESAARMFVEKLNSVILFPIIFLLSGVALLVFLYGAFRYVTNASSETGRQEGQRTMMYGLIGLLIMISAYALLSVAAGTFGLSNTLQNCTAGQNCIQGP